MLLLNFSHPLTDVQLAAIAENAGLSIQEVREIPVQFDLGLSFVTQAAALVDSAGLTPRACQTQPLLINIHGNATIAAVMLAELHGRAGHFPAIIRLKPAEGPLGVYEFAEIINMEALRIAARQRR